MSAINSASTPITVLLEPGNYDAIPISAKSGITLRSASDSNPATLRGLNIKGSSNITIDNIKLGGSNVNLQYRVYVYKSNNVKLSRINVPGTTGTFDTTVGTAIMFRQSSEILLTNFYISWSWFGVGFLDVSNLTIQNGVVRDIRTDAIRGGGVHGLLIQGNDLSQFHPVYGDHPDGIQLWSKNESASSENIIIRDNLVSRDGGDRIQGIFIRDTTLNLPFINVLIENNIISGGAYNGIAILGTITSKIKGNTVIGYEDQKSWIRVNYAQDASVEDSVANALLLDPNVGSGGNEVVPQSQTAAMQAAATWRSMHGY